ncbi:MAG: prepilin-type N-terminal cleavage/methylation domain-containing protein [Thermoleophilia bacterium]|jgi:prepilin-type N-terminal cleavage/methylation domain-containing protein|nr:prepilin-type N-terminal cleavage/methylation domain-containing protein [Thermoleophilia bacterium]
MCAVRRRGGRGFTLIEVLLAIIVVALLAAVAIPALSGVRGSAEGSTAASLLRGAAPALEAHLTAEGTYAGATPAVLRTIEPSVKWRDEPGAKARGAEVSVEVTGPRSFVLTSADPGGVVYRYAKDLDADPTVTRTCGPGCDW